MVRMSGSQRGLGRRELAGWCRDGYGICGRLHGRRRHCWLRVYRTRAQMCSAARGFGMALWLVGSRVTRACER